MFGSTAFALGVPSAEELVFVYDMAVIFRPDPEGFAAGAVGCRQTAQLAELLRELRDFR